MCPQDCGVYCGNRVCEADEYLWCPQDCGSGYCGDFVCWGDEPNWCPDDCGFCGDDHCAVGESDWCTFDCGAICGDQICQDQEYSLPERLCGASAVLRQLHLRARPTCMVPGRWLRRLRQRRLRARRHPELPRSMLRQLKGARIPRVGRRTCAARERSVRSAGLGGMRHLTGRIQACAKDAHPSIM